MILILICVLILSTPVMADNTLTASIADFKLFIEGEQKTSQNPTVIINDYTYLPLREISNLLGLDVEWDEKTQSIYIDDASVEYDNYIGYEEDGLWGYKNSNGDVVIEPQYAYAYDFCEGVAQVQFEDLSYGYINMNGVCFYKGLGNKYFSDGMGLVYEYLDPPVTVHEDGSMTFTSDVPAEEFFIDKSGNVVTDRYYYAHPFSEGLAMVQIEGSDMRYDSTNRYSYIHKNGKLATDLKFLMAGSFENGYAEVTTEDGKTGKIDKMFNFYPEND